MRSGFAVLSARMTKAPGRNHQSRDPRDDVALYDRAKVGVFDRSMHAFLYGRALPVEVEQEQGSDASRATGHPR